MMYYIRNKKGEYLTKAGHSKLEFQKDVTKALMFKTKESAESFCEMNKYEHVGGRVALREYDYIIKGLGVDKV